MILQRCAGRLNEFYIPTPLHRCQMERNQAGLCCELTYFKIPSLKQEPEIIARTVAVGTFRMKSGRNVLVDGNFRCFVSEFLNVSHMCACRSTLYSRGLATPSEHVRDVCHHRPRIQKVHRGWTRGTEIFHGSDLKPKLLRAVCVRNCESRRGEYSAWARCIFTDTHTHIHLQACPVTSTKSPCLGWAVTRHLGILA